MITKTSPLALLLSTLTAFTALASLGCDTDPGDEFDTVDVDSAVLSLDDGGELIFLGDDDGEVTIIEANGATGLGHLAALDEGVTPAELWVALSGVGADADAAELPEFLVDHHEASVDRELELDLDLLLPTPRSLEYPASWGGSSGYCRNGFPGAFEAYNPVTTQVSVSTEALSYYAYSNAYVRHAYVAVCNDTPTSESGTLSGLNIATWNAAYNIWMPVACDASVCLSLTNQEAQAVHYWTSSPAGKKLRIEAKNTGGVVHRTKLRAGFAALGF